MANPLFDTLFAVHRTSDRPFLIPPTGPTIAYSAFLDRASQMAGALTAAGLRAGDRVAVQVAKSPDALALYAASVQAGLVFLPLNTGYTGAELRYFIEDSGAGLLIADPATPGLSALAPQHLTLDRDGAGTLATLAAAQSKTFETVPRRTTDLAALLYTSGTTGRSKGAMLSQGNLLSNAETLAQAWRFSASDTLLHALPIFHTHGLFVATNITLIAGGAMIFLPKFDLDPVFATLPRATAMMGVPTFYTRLLGDARLSKAAVAHMRLFVSGSAPLLAETHARFEAATGHRILERYGMTETNMNASNPYDGPR
ncbi:MAG: AMP-binding protein, partial [Pseudomonadota bacterium]